MCVWCPLWPVQRRLSEQPELSSRPLILFAEGRRGLIVTACSPEALRLDIRVGMPLGEFPDHEERCGETPIGQHIEQSRCELRMRPVIERQCDLRLDITPWNRSARQQPPP